MLDKIESEPTHLDLVKPCHNSAIQKSCKD